MKNKIKIIFLSTSSFGIPALKKLALDKRFEVFTLITSLDKPKGRGMKIELSEIKKSAMELGIKVLEINDIKELKWEEEIKKMEPDVMVMASYGKIVPKNILEIPAFGVLNIHPSLLPKFRGSSPIQSAILADEDKTGVTIMLTTEKMDAGPILKSKVKSQKLKVKFKKLHNDLAEIGAELICEVIPDWVSGKIKSEPQNEALATYTKKITKENGLINWEEPAEIIERKIRAYEVWPVAYFFTPHLLKNKKNIYTEDKILKKGEGFIKKNNGADLRVQVLTAEAVNENSGRKIGEFFEYENSLAIQAGNGILKLLKVKPEGKNEIEGREFFKNYLK